jgi:hypothetical protein
MKVRQYQAAKNRDGHGQIFSIGGRDAEVGLDKNCSSSQSRDESLMNWLVG